MAEVKQTLPTNSFNAGEVSPKVDFRSDVEKYDSACLILENVIPMVEGGGKRMPGSYFVVEVKDSSGKPRITSFHFSTEQAYALEFGHEYIRFCKDEGQIVSNGSAYEISTPYDKDDLNDLKFIQSADVMWIFHKSYPTKELTRSGHTAWTLTDHQAKTGDEMAITGINKASTAVVTCTDVPDTLAAGDIVYISGVSGMTEVNDLFFTVGTVNTSANTFELASTNSSAYTTYTSGGIAQECVFGTADNRPACGSFYEQRLAMGGTTNAPQTINFSASADFDDFDIGTTASPKVDDADAIQYRLSSNRVDGIRWMSGQDYLMIGTVGGVWKFGATAMNDPLTPVNVVAKKQVTIGVKDVDSEVVSDSVFWITRSGLAVRQLIFSFERDKFVAPDLTRIAKHITFGDSKANSGITGMDFQSEPIPILWAVRADGQLLGMTYETQENVFAWFRVVTDGEFESIAILTEDSQEDQLWAIVKRTIDGSTVRYIEYFKPQEIYSTIADSFFVHSGLTWEGTGAATITDITQADPAVVTAAAHGFSDDDLIRISGVLGMTEVNQGRNDVYTVDNATTNTFSLAGADFDYDSTGWTEYESGGTAIQVIKTITGLTHLVGEEVDILADGAVVPSETVDSDGEIIMDWYSNLVHIGLGYTSTIKPMKPHVVTRKGSSRGKKQKIHKITLLFFETFGCKAGPDADHLKTLPFGVGDQPALFTGDKDFTFNGNWSNEATVIIVQDIPLPMTILGLITHLSIED